MRPLLIAIVMAAMSAISSVATAESAAAQTPRHDWPPLPHPIIIYYNPEGQPDYITTSDVEYIIMSSLYVWGTSCGYRMAAYGGVDKNGDVLNNNDGVSVIGWLWNDKNVGYTYRGGKYQNEVDIALIANDSMKSRQSVANVIMHEFGHLYGIGHNEADAQSVMASEVSMESPMKISPRDAETCRSVYANAKGIGISFSAGKL